MFSKKSEPHTKDVVHKRVNVRINVWRAYWTDLSAEPPHQSNTAQPARASRRWFPPGSIRRAFLRLCGLIFDAISGDGIKDGIDALARDGAFAFVFEFSVDEINDG